MKTYKSTTITKYLTSYQIAIFLSSISAGLGIVREFMIVGLLGFTTHNDILQVYLSIFYTIGLSIDAMRLACLNLYPFISLARLLTAASSIGLPFSILVGLIMSYAAQTINIQLLSITIFGSYLNLIASLLITYAQRNNFFIAAQLINILPNFILIPGIMICHWCLHANIITSFIYLISLIPIIQCGILLFLPQKPQIFNKNTLSFYKIIMTFIRHFTSMIGEQTFQIIIRSAFYQYGPGYLSIYAISVRIYSAIRFILIDSFIGAKFAEQKTQILPADNYIAKMINPTIGIVLIAISSLIISLKPQHELIYSSIQMISILIVGFYLSTLVRIIYFKINQHGNNSVLALKFAAYEIICAICAYCLIWKIDNSIFTGLWLGYIAKPFVQLLLLRNKYYMLQTE